MLRKLAENKGGSTIEWALLSGLLAAVSITAVIKGGASAPDVFANYADNLQTSAPIQPGGQATLSGDTCFIGTEGDDHITFDESTTCYRLTAGDDHFAGAASAAPLVVDAGEGRGGFTSIVTGAGDDHIISAQSGLISTGDGNDIIDLSLSQSARFDIQPGPGNDRLSLITGDPPNGASANKLSSGQGSLSADLSCADTPLAFHIEPGSTTDLTGDCAIEAVTSGGPGRRDVTARLTGFSGRLDAGDHLLIDIETTQAAPTASPQGLYIPDWVAGRIAYRTSSLTQADFALASLSEAASGSVDVSLRAPAGVVSLDGTGQAAWSISAFYTDAGQISLTFPDESGFMRMQAPRLSGQAETLRIAGCFDSLRLLRAQSAVWTADACPSDTPQSFSIDPSDDDLSLELIRGGDRQVIALGASDLVIRRVVISR